MNPPNGPAVGKNEFCPSGLSAYAPFPTAQAWHKQCGPPNKRGLPVMEGEKTKCGLAEVHCVFPSS